jgi:hypothetical protein
MITVTLDAHAPTTITTGGYAQIKVSPNDIRITHDGKTEVFATGATKSVVAIAVV